MGFLARRKKCPEEQWSPQERVRVERNGTFTQPIIPHLISPLENVPFPILEPVVESQELLDTHPVDMPRVLLRVWPGQRLAF